MTILKITNQLGNAVFPFIIVLLTLLAFTTCSKKENDSLSKSPTNIEPSSNSGNNETVLTSYLRFLLLK